MAKVVISASVEESTRDIVNAAADKDSRSFSAMIDIMLKEAIAARAFKSEYIICPVCGAVNCRNNETCIGCSSYLKLL